MKYHNDNVQHISEVTLKVKDLEIIKDFYLNILGFSIIKENENTVSFSANNKDVLLNLIKIEDAQISKTTGLYHIAYLLPNRNDLASFVLHLHNKHIHFGAGDHLVSEAIYFNDPEGNGIEVYVDRDDSFWNYNKDSIEMATLPVDFDDLLKEKVYDFKKAPKETIIGHLHLQVNNIEENRKFYADILKFDIVANYNNSALFLSSQKYHHHIAFNIWAGSLIPHQNEFNTGIKSYVLKIPKAKQLNIDSNIQLFDPNNIEVIIERGN